MFKFKEATKSVIKECLSKPNGEIKHWVPDDRFETRAVAFLNGDVYHVGFTFSDTVPRVTLTVSSSYSCSNDNISAYNDFAFFSFVFDNVVAMLDESAKIGSIDYYYYSESVPTHETISGMERRLIEFLDSKKKELSEFSRKTSILERFAAEKPDPLLELLPDDGVTLGDKYYSGEQIDEILEKIDKICENNFPENEAEEDELEDYEDEECDDEISEKLITLEGLLREIENRTE